MTDQPIRFVIFNGPPGSGKSTAARLLSIQLTNKLGIRRVITDSFAHPMKHFISVILNEQYQLMDKEKPRPELNGYSVREFLIDMSETKIKPRYGDDAFGRWLYHRALKTIPLPLIVISDDGGFEPEVEAIPNRILIHLKRHEKDFSRDSRSYLPNPDYVIFNNHTIDDLNFNLVGLAARLINEVRL